MNDWLLWLLLLIITTAVDIDIMQLHADESHPLISRSKTIITDEKLSQTDGKYLIWQDWFLRTEFQLYGKDFQSDLVFRIKKT